MGRARARGSPEAPAGPHGTRNPGCGWTASHRGNVCTWRSGTCPTRCHRRAGCRAGICGWAWQDGPWHRHARAGRHRAGAAVHGEEMQIPRRWRIRSDIAGPPSTGENRPGDGGPPQARAYLEEALALHRHIKNQPGIGSAHWTLGDVATEMRDEERAASHYLQPRATLPPLVTGSMSPTRSKRSPPPSSVGSHRKGTRLLGAAATARDRLGLSIDPNARDATRPGTRHRPGDAWRTRVRRRLGGWAGNVTRGRARARLADRRRLPAADAGPGIARLGISPRELEVLCLLAEGRTDREIADALS